MGRTISTFSSDIARAVSRSALGGASARAATYPQINRERDPAAPDADWIEDPAYGEQIGFFDWDDVIAMTFRKWTP